MASIARRSPAPAGGVEHDRSAAEPGTTSRAKRVMAKAPGDGRGFSGAPRRAATRVNALATWLCRQRLDFSSTGSPNAHPVPEGATMSYSPGRFVWFEHHSNDIPKARAFYEKLFGWNTEMMAVPSSEPYPVIHNGDAGIGGYGQAQAGTPTRWMSSLSVSEVDSAYKAALAAGAKSVMAPTDYGSAGRAATIADPTGAVFSLWKGAEGDPAETATTPPG